ncbi:MAG: hypothetical protein GXO14_03515 [Thermococci archaeon]|nr:hypothetical protein [Thermococci archaeon]
MKFEVLSKEDMNALSRELSRAGIMNSRFEVDDEEVFHQAVLRGKYRELLNSCNITAVEESLESIRRAYDEMMKDWEVGQEKSVEELFEESDVERLTLVTALVEMGVLEEGKNGLKLVKHVPLDDVELELRFPLEEIYDEDEDKLKCFKIVTEVSISKRYYVRVMEVDRDLIEKAIQIAEDYATEESRVNAMFAGMARSLMADMILKLAEEYPRKDRLIEAIMEREPLEIGSEAGSVQVYFDEDAVESFIKELQSMGYLKVKGNRIWVY